MKNKALAYCCLMVLMLIFNKSFSQSFYALDFTENKGQWSGNFNFRAEAGNGAFFLEKQGFTILQHHPDDFKKINDFMHGGHSGDNNSTMMDKDRQKENLKSGIIEHTIPSNGKSNENFTIRSHAVKVHFVGSNSNPNFIPEKKREGYDNYFLGNDTTKWKSNVNAYGAMLCKELYPQTDVRYYSESGKLKYDIILHPGANPTSLVMEYEGAENLKVKNNELYIGTSVGTINEMSPYAYQIINGQKVEVGCKFKVKGNQLRFELSNYDNKSTLVIDPMLIFASYTGSKSGNWGFTATPGNDGSFFAGGVVFNGGGYPVSAGAYQSQFKGGGSLGVDVSITRFSPTGNSRMYSTYLGGKDDEFPHSLFADPQGNLVILGRTSSSDFPYITKAGNLGQTDIFVSKLNSAGTNLIGSMKIGGSGVDGANMDPSGQANCNGLLYNYGDNSRSEVILDANNNVYIASQTSSTDFPLVAAFQTILGGKQDGVVIKLNPNLTSIQFSSYLGGSGDDASFVLSLNPFNNDIYVAGGTSSPNMPKASNTFGGAIDGFVSIIPNTGGTLKQTKYFGTDLLDIIYGIQFDTKGFPYIMGISLGDWTVTANAKFSNPGSKQFISKLLPDLSNYVYSTVYGSANAIPNISPVAFLVDRCENVYVSGWGGKLNPCFGNNCFDNKTAGPLGMPLTPDAIKSTTDNRDFYFFVLEKDANSQLYGSYFGQTGGEGDHVDGGTSRFDKRGAIYQAICANCLGSNACPTSPITLPLPVTPGVIAPVNAALGTGSGGDCNLYAVKILFDFQGVAGGARASIDGMAYDTSGCVPLKVDFEDTIATAKSYEWDFGDGSPKLLTTNTNVSHSFNSAGIYTVQMVAIDDTKCISRDTTYIYIRARTDKALLDFTETKLQPCQNLSFLFTNGSISPAGKVFGANSFVWDFGDNTPKITTGNGTITHMFAAAGTYTVKMLMKDTSFCNYPDSLVATLRIAPNVVSKFNSNKSGCAPYSAVFSNVSIAGQTFTWDFGDGTTYNGVTPPPKIYNTPGVYTVSLIASDPSTCNLVDTSTITITVHDNPLANFSFTPNPGQENTPTNFINTSTGAIKYFWSFGDGDTSLQINPIHQYMQTASFPACLTAINAFGCADSICQRVSSIILPLVDIPNAFTPNNDGTNDVIFVRGFGIEKMNLMIFNRQGKLVFQSASQNIGWDGKYKGQLQPFDAYAYVLEVQFADGNRVTKKGDITLLR